MSDKTADEYPDYQERTREEVDQVVAQFRGAGTTNYTAQPAEGYDVEGIWHCFGSHQRTGYATHAMSLHWMLSEVLGITTELVPHRSVDVDIERFPSDRYDLLFKWLKSPVGIPYLQFSSYPPEMSVQMSGVAPKLVPYCAFEGTRVSKFGKELCIGGAFEEIWVVSDFVKSAMVAGGIDEKFVRVVRPMLCGGPWEMYPEADLQRAKSRTVTEEDPFTFGVLGTWQKRKGMHDLVKAYFQTFKREEPVRLVIRTSPFTRDLTIQQFKDLLTGEIADIAAELGDDDFPESQAMPRLEFVLGTDATDQEVIEWLASMDCYANPSYGEGLGIPHIWAKANGVPMVSTDYGAIGDLLTGIETSKPRKSQDELVAHRLAPVDAEVCKVALMFDRKTQWGVYDVADFGAAMRRMFEKGRRFDPTCSFVRAAFSPEVCTEYVRTGLKALLEPKQVEDWAL